MPIIHRVVRPSPIWHDWFCALLSCLCMAAHAHAEPAETRPVITAECQMIVVPSKLALQLIPELSDPAKIAAAWPRVQSLIASGEATLAATLFGEGSDGKTITAASTEEFRYGTEFEPPEVPDSFYDSAGLLPKLSPEMLKNWPIVGITPTAFETRNLGQRMELTISATAGPSILACIYKITHTRLEHMDKIDAGRLANGERLSLEQPRISEMSDESSTTMESGTPKLLGVHRLPGGEGKFELFLLKLTTHLQKTP